MARARALQIVEETDDPSTFSFRHAITREVTFDDQLAAQRRPLHRRIAAALEARGMDDRTLDTLAYHWWAAGDGAKALIYGERAGDHAQSVHDYEGAVACYERTRALLDPHDPDVSRITAKIAGSFFRAGAMDRAAASYRIAWESLQDATPDAAFSSVWHEIWPVPSTMTAARKKPSTCGGTRSSCSLPPATLRSRT